MKTIETTVKNNLCISCGICKGLCNKSAISYERSNGMYYPQIDNNLCTQCGICYENCPGKGVDYSSWIKENNDIQAQMEGKVISSYNAWSGNNSVRRNSASGGVVTTIISNLLQNDLYDVAYVVRSFNYENQVKTQKIRSINVDQEYVDETKYSSKSRYIPVSHELCVQDMINNRNKRIIIVGTSCTLQGIRNVIDYYHLDSDNYLLIGLFCESVMNYNVWGYFSSEKYSSGKQVSAIHFKNKESGDWPGNMKLIFSDGSFKYIDKKERMNIKEYFKPERCLYCIDKLNIVADISVGDNYTGCDDSKLGSNSVIIRTLLGEKIWQFVSDGIDFVPVDIEKIAKAQLLDQRMDNLQFAHYKEQSFDVDQDDYVINQGINEDKFSSNIKKRTYNMKKFTEYAGGGAAYSPLRFGIVKNIRRCFRLPRKLKRIFTR